MRTALVILALLATTTIANAACIGTGKFRTCYDANGNQYTISDFGSTTITNGYNARTGSQWSQTDTTFGNTTFTNGQAANGNSWNMTQQNWGNGYKTYSGTDSSGNFFSGTCTSYFGCD